MWECAGVCGVHPGIFTLYELGQMRLAKEKSEWDKAAMLAYTVASLVSEKAKYEQFHPYMKSESKSLNKQQVKSLKGLFKQKEKKQYGKSTV